MNKLNLTLILTFSINIVFSQSDSTKIPFIAYWWKGDSYDFKVTKVEQKWSNDKLIKMDSSQYIANFKVIDSTMTSYKIQWTFKNTLISNLQEKISKIYNNPKKINDIISNYNITKVIYSTNEFGEFVEIENWKEIRILVKELMHELEKSIEIKYPETDKKIKELLTPLIKLYSSKEGIEQYIMSPLIYFHFPLGAEYNAKEIIEYEEELPNIFGDSPIKGTAKLSVDELDLSKNFCILKEVVSINEEDIRQLTSMMIKKMGINEKEIDKLLKSSIIDIQDLNYYEYHYFPGIPHRIYNSRRIFFEIENSKTESISELIIEMIYHN